MLVQAFIQYSSQAHFGMWYLFPAWFLTDINIMLFPVFSRRWWWKLRKTYLNEWFKWLCSTYRRSLREPHPFQAETPEKACWMPAGGSWPRRHRQTQGILCSTRLLDCSEKGPAMSCVEWRCVLCDLGNEHKQLTSYFMLEKLNCLKHTFTITHSATNTI